MTGSTAVSGVGVWQTWRETPNTARALLLGTLVNRLGSFLQVFIVLYLIHDGFSDAQAAGALGAYGAGSVLGMLVGGLVSDAFGGRRTIVASMTCSAVFLLLVYYLGPYPAKLVVLVAGGAASQAYRPAAASLLSGLVPRGRQVMVFAMNRLAINIGATVLPLAGVVLSAVSYGLLFGAEAATAVCYALIAVVALPRRTPSVRAPGDMASGPPTEDRPARTGALAGIPRDRRYLLFCSAILLHIVIYVQHVVILPLFLQYHHFPTLVYGVLTSINGFLIVTCELFVTKFTQNRPVRIVVACGIGLTGLGMCLYDVRLGLVGLVLATLMWTLGEMIGGPTIYFAYPAHAGPTALRGRYLGLSNAVYGLGNTIGPVVGVLAWNRFGDGSWLLCGAVGVLAVTAGWCGVRPDVMERDPGGGNP